MIYIMKEKKPYQSKLREEQVKRTRDQILEGLIQTMKNGIATLSIPAVAREAGVSVPTVYRYFRTKQDLVAALAGYAAEKVGASITQPPRTPEELVSMVRELFIKSEGADEALRLAAVSELYADLRKAGLPGRLKAFEDALAPVSEQLSEADRIRLRNIVLILSSSAMIRAFKDYLHLSGEAAADNATWAILTLIRGATLSDEMLRQQELPRTAENQGDV
jgi:AcrR family transcriptional regulator